MILSPARRNPPTLAVDPTALARAVTGRDSLANVSCELRPVHGPEGESTGGVYRLRGEGHDGNQRLFWHVLVKVCTVAGGSGDPQRRDYWRREADAFASGVLDSLPPGVRAPQCFAVDAREDYAHIYMADVDDSSDVAWTTGDFVTAARCLGAFNGAFLRAVPIPEGAWVSRGWLRAHVEELGAAIERLDRLADRPRFSMLYPGEATARVRALWRERERLLDALDGLTHTFAHLNAVRGNLARTAGAGGTPELTAVDWARAGAAPLGQELAALVVGSCLDFDLELTDLRLVEELSIASYASALRGSGWYGDERAIRFGYAASAALRYTALCAHRLDAVLDGPAPRSAERGIEHGITPPIDGSTARCVAVRDYALRLADQATALLRAM